MKIIDVCQGSEEWHEVRYKKIGGTGAGDLMSKTSYDKLKLDLLGAHLEPFELEESFTSTAMQRGIELEPLARQYLEDYTGLVFNEYGWLQSDIDCLGISPDGLTEDQTISCEIKCPSKAVHMGYILGKTLPYFWQNINYFAINTKLEKHYFISYRPESMIPGHIIELTRDTEVYRTKTICGKIGDFADELRLSAAKMDKELKQLLTETKNKYMI